MDDELDDKELELLKQVKLLEFIAECQDDTIEPKEYLLHTLVPPSYIRGWIRDPEFGLGYQSESYAQRYPHIWFACQYPDRPVDEAIMFDMKCEMCEVEQEKRGCPVSQIPPIPGDAPVFRELVYRELMQ